MDIVALHSSFILLSLFVIKIKCVPKGNLKYDNPAQKHISKGCNLLFTEIIMVNSKLGNKVMWNKRHRHIDAIEVIVKEKNASNLFGNI